MRWWPRRNNPTQEADWRGDRAPMCDGDRVPVPGYRPAREILAALAEPTAELHVNKSRIFWSGRRHDH